MSFTLFLSHNPTAKQCFIAKSPKLYQVTFHFLPSQRLQNIFYILCWNCCISNCSGHLLQKGIGLQQICNYLQIINIQTSLITACRSYKITSMIKNLRCVIIKPLRSTLLQAFRQHKSNAFTTDSTDPFLLSFSEEEKIRGKKNGEFHDIWVSINALLLKSSRSSFHSVPNWLLRFT